MKSIALYFDGQGAVFHKSEESRLLLADQVRVKSRYSAISAGTELLFYRGEVPDEMAVDATFANQQKKILYPVKYGYSVVGEIIETGSKISKSLLGRRVFAFQSHQQQFCCNPEELMFVPENIDDLDALFLPNMETAVNLVMDGRPLLNEDVLVIGGGIIGALTIAVLNRFPLNQLALLEKQAGRIAHIEKILTKFSGNIQQIYLVNTHEKLKDDTNFDLIFELSGNPAALDTALLLAGYGSRIVLGSWYGRKTSAIHFGGKFHRDRVKIFSSQVSSIAPELSGRWTKERRFESAWQMIDALKPASLITRVLPFEDAALAYRQLDKDPASQMQIVFRYENEVI